MGQHQNKQPETSKLQPSYLALVCGSPFAGGTCAQLSDQLQAAFEKSGTQVTRIDISSVHISPCIGCNRCAADGTCFMHDDADTVIDVLQHSSGLVIVSPVYFGGPPSQLKAMFDRFQPLFWSHKNGHLDKPCWLLAVGSGGDPYGHRALDICVASAISMLGYRLSHVQSCIHETVEESVQSFVHAGGLQFFN